MSMLSFKEYHELFYFFRIKLLSHVKRHAQPAHTTALNQGTYLKTIQSAQLIDCIVVVDLLYVKSLGVQDSA